MEIFSSLLVLLFIIKLKLKCAAKANSLTEPARLPRKVYLTLLTYHIRKIYQTHCIYENQYLHYQPHP